MKAMAIVRKAKKKHIKRKKADPRELEKTAHRQEIRNIFRHSGFSRVGGVSDKNFTFMTRMGDVDDVYIYENIVVLIEYTISQSSDISTHLLKKKVIFDLILENQAPFIGFFADEFETFDAALDEFYQNDQFHVVIVYASKNSIEGEHKEHLPEVVFLDLPIVKYFGSLTNAVKKSARFELFAFLGLKSLQIGPPSVKPSVRTLKYDGTLLPENHSNFDKGYKLVSFYIDPETLLTNSYVLRRHGWRDETDLYQRMISVKKINQIRRYLNDNGRVFVNNIIVTLPSNTKLIDEDGDTINPAALSTTTPVTIQIPDSFNIIGLIDGQHRIFAYHEGGEFEEKIAKLRKMQNLLATGIVYPRLVKELDKRKFESQLFLEINSTQANASSELKQAIGLMLRPFSAESIAKALINKLNGTSPLKDRFEVRFYEQGKIKTTSIVSYGLRPIVKLSGTDSFYSFWNESSKADLLDETDLELLDKYIGFCAAQLNTFLGAVRAVAPDKWTTDTSTKDRVLSTTAINGLVICFRKLIENGKTGDSAYYRTRLQELNGFNFADYKSSQYGAMSRALYSEFFEN